jgi:hypothetical protein
LLINADSLSINLSCPNTPLINGDWEQTRKPFMLLNYFLIVSFVEVFVKSMDDSKIMNKNLDNKITSESSKKFAESDKNPFVK